MGFGNRPSHREGCEQRGVGRGSHRNLQARRDMVRDHPKSRFQGRPRGSMRGQPPSSGTRVVLQADLSANPACIHGPTLAWARTGRAPERAFFACSAFRDRQACRVNSGPGPLPAVPSHPSLDLVLERQLQARPVRALRPNHGSDYCLDCHMWLSESSVREKHREHERQTAVAFPDQPQMFLNALSHNRGQAQYHFVPSTLDTLVSWITLNDWHHVLAIGVPSLMPALRDSGVEVLLLDIDDRLASFYDEGTDWLWYNLFNHHFFTGSTSKAALAAFLQRSSDLVIVTDPPFGGKCELIARTLTLITRQWRGFHGLLREPQLFWVFPYFMEKKILASMDTLVMSDLRVEYQNHKRFNDRASSNGSPVRVFTNVDLSRLPLSQDQGYRYCEPCHKWVGLENRHCPLCATCTSKNGEPYRHCAVCRRCVKEKFEHCAKCQRCALPMHPCQLFQDNPMKGPEP